MYITINGKRIQPKELNNWKKKSYERAVRHLKRNMNITDDVEEMRQQLTAMKLQYSYEKMLALLKGKLRISEAVMKCAVFLSRGHRKSSMTEIDIKGLTAKELIDGIDDFMLHSSKKNQKINLSVCPEHYVLRPLEDHTLEVIETAGNAPLPVQFFIAFGNDHGLQTPRDSTYPYQSAGIAMLKNGTIIGGVRHQFKDTDDGCQAKLLVEFPAACPNSLIKSHQMHLACEFSYWIQTIMEQESGIK